MAAVLRARDGGKVSRTHDLDGREYKLLLAPDALPGETAKQKAKALWTERLAGIVERSLGPRAHGGARHSGGFAKQKMRRIRFYDAVPLLLHPRGFAFRDRTTLDGDGNDKDREVTLKLRLKDRPRVARADLSGTNARARTKLEEDIGPRLVRARGGQGFALAARRSTRTLYALSTTQPAPARRAFAQVGDIARLYPALPAALRARSGRRLRCGPEIREVVLEGATVDLGKVEGAFAFTLWRFAPSAGRPDIAEISFRCETEDGRIAARAAARAQALFLAMQDGLRDALYLAGPSKTALALPG